jgi:hypothetical protein
MNHAHHMDYEGLGAEGAGLYGWEATFRIDRSSVRNNVARGGVEFAALGGGARFSNCLATITDSFFLRNAVGDRWPNTPGHLGWGGALAADRGELVVSDSRFDRNWAPDGGGSVWGEGRYVRCELTRSRARRGGAAFATSERMSFLKSRIDGNRAESDPYDNRGGGVYGPASLKHVVLSNNHAFGNGGGAGGAWIVDSDLFGNTIEPPPVPREVWGAGAYLSGLVRCRVFDNEARGTELAASYGGGAALSDLSQCRVYGNQASFGGGVADSDLDRGTLFRNVALVDGGGLYASGPSIVNSSVLWADTPFEILDAGGLLTVEWSDVQGMWPGTGNVSWYPDFFDPSAGDFHLRPYSYCIDRGDPSVLDPDGTRCDMGALPYDPSWTGRMVITDFEARPPSWEAGADLSMPGLGG